MLKQGVFYGEEPGAASLELQPGSLTLTRPWWTQQRGHLLDMNEDGLISFLRFTNQILLFLK